MKILKFGLDCEVLLEKNVFSDNLLQNVFGKVKKLNEIAQDEKAFGLCVIVHWKYQMFICKGKTGHYTVTLPHKGFLIFLK